MSICVFDYFGIVAETVVLIAPASGYCLSVNVFYKSFNYTLHFKIN